jgi:hypothetical protein
MREEQKNRDDRLYRLMPAIHRIRDLEQGEPLRALLQVISEQVNLVEDDIARLYDNWFIETCEDWVVPYIGDLIGFRQVREAGEPGDPSTAEGRARTKILIPRRDLANTIRYRRRKGTLALLELLANDVAGWPARAVEFFKLLGWTQAVNYLHLDRGRTIDVRNGDALELIDGPFDSSAHTVDVRRANSLLAAGRYNIPSVGLFVWRLRSYSVTETPACCLEGVDPSAFTFSALGNDAPLFTLAKPETDPTEIAGELNLPAPIRRRALETRLADYYGEGKSLQIFVGARKTKQEKIGLRPVPADRIVVVDLSDWQYFPQPGSVAVDPELGRIAFPLGRSPNDGVWVSYHYGFSAEIGGGEYNRPLSQPIAHTIYRVGKLGEFATINQALKKFQSDEAVTNGVIEITDSAVYVEPLDIALKAHQSLQLRAANRKRPIIHLLDWKTNLPDSLSLAGEEGSRFTIDGLLVTGRSLRVAGDVAELTIRHTTLVPGWMLGGSCESQRPAEPSLELYSPRICVRIEHSICGSIHVSPEAVAQTPGTQGKDRKQQTPKAREETALAYCRGISEEVRLDPIAICISDSILDATDTELEALGAPDCLVAHATLTILRSTVIGQIQTHAIQLGENCIFDGCITVARRQQGCLRFSYVTPGSRTPRRFHCQPDLVEKAVEDDSGIPAGPLREAAKQRERERVRPQFNNKRYGTPTYCQLAAACAGETNGGADDESEMGVFHDLFHPQREANLRARLDEFLPAGMNAGIIFAN